MLSVFNNLDCILSSIAENKICTEIVGVQCHVNNAKSVVSGNLLHQRLGHPCRNAMKYILPHLSLNSSVTLPDFCDSCQHGKMHQFSYYFTNIKSLALLELIHTDF